MSGVLGSLAVLGIGAVLSLLLVRQPRLGMLSAMLAILVSSVLCFAAAMNVLVPPAAGLIDVAAARTVAWPMPLGSATFSLDGLSAWFLLTIALLSAAVAIYSPAYMRDQIGHGPVPAFSALMCLLVAALVIVVCAADAVLFLVGWEVMTLAAFGLVGFHNRDGQVQRGAWMYLIATHLGTGLCVLPMFALLVAKSGGETSFAVFGQVARWLPGHLCVLLFLLGLVGFGTKAGFMPMHVWLPNAHPVAPTPVSALLSGVVIKTGIYGLLRLLTWLPPLPSGCAMVMLAVGIISGVLGVAYALAQHDLKRLLAYHSVENIGIIGLGIGMGMLGQTSGHPALAAIGYGGALLHVLNHALFKGLLFLSAGSVIHSTGTGQIDRLGGLARKTPVNAILFLVAAVSICGLPPFNGFVSEWLIYGSLFGGAMSLRSAGAVIGLTALAIMGGLALACFAKVFSVVFLGESRDESHAHAHRTPILMGTGMAMLALLCVGIGVAPGLAVPLTAGAVAEVTHVAPAQFAGSLGQWLAPMGTITLLAAVFAGIVLVLLLARRQAGRAIGHLTWHGRPAHASCGTPQAWPVLRPKRQEQSDLLDRPGEERSALADSPGVPGECPGVPGRMGGGAHATGDGSRTSEAVAERGEAIAQRVATWGCGYAFPTARMQYTASSFAWSLVCTLRHFLWPQRHVQAPVGYFPAAGHLATHAEDVAEVDLFAPLFGAVHRLAAMLKTVSWSGAPVHTTAADGSAHVLARIGPFRAGRRVLVAAARRGTIHLCLTYIVLVLVILFVVEALLAPHAETPAAPPAAAAVPRQATPAGGPLR